MKRFGRRTDRVAQGTITTLPALWPDSPARRERLRDVDALVAMPLAPELPALGATLDQLRLQRAPRRDATPAM